MARWQPDSRVRLQDAALALFEERGYEATTAAQIAARAGLTERTFFRHFGDKREVLFANEAAMQAALVGAVGDAPEGAPVAALVRAGLEAVGTQLEPRRAELRRRAAIIASHPALRERELAKQEATAIALAEALGARGVEAAEATLAAEVAVAVLRVAFDRWIAGAGDDLRTLAGAALDGLAAVA